MAESFDVQDFEGFELLPDDELETTPDEDMADAFRGEPLDPEDDPELYPPDPAPYGRSWDFDPIDGHFVRYGIGPAETRDMETLKGWIMRVMLTARTAHAIFDDTHGMDSPFGLIGGVQGSVSTAEYQEDLTQALLRHDRIAEVSDFHFEDPDETEYMLVGFTVVTDGSDDNLRLEVPVPLNA